MSELADLIRDRLTDLAPDSLTIDDDSADHAGHAGNTGGGHFTLTIVSPVFQGQRLLARHRLIKDKLADLFPQRIHALSIKAYAPDEI